MSVSEEGAQALGSRAQPGKLRTMTMAQPEEEAEWPRRRTPEVVSVSVTLTCFLFIVAALVVSIA